MSIETQQLKKVLQAAMMSFGQPLNVERLLALFDEDSGVSKNDIREAIGLLQTECADSGIELVEVASGYRYQSKQEHAPWVGRLWEEKPPRYSRALLETLVLVAYRQPITRGEIESIRGVTVNTQTIKTLLERDWIKVVGHRDVPGRPAIYATTKAFLDYFNLRSLDQLPSLSEIRDLDKIKVAPDFAETDESSSAADSESGSAEVAAVATDEVSGREVQEGISASDEINQNAEQNLTDEHSQSDELNRDEQIREEQTIADDVEGHENSDLDGNDALESDTVLLSDSDEQPSSIDEESALEAAAGEIDDGAVQGNDATDLGADDDDDFVDFSLGEDDDVLGVEAAEAASNHSHRSTEEDDEFVDFSMTSASEVDADDYDPEAESSNEPEYSEPVKDFEEMYADIYVQDDARELLQDLQDDQDTVDQEKHAAAE